MRTVKEVSRLTGVSVRTLHHYDAIGLLRPARVTEAGYRLYDEAALYRLQSILLLRELQFSLKEIAAILDSPGFDREQALCQQIELLKKQRAQIDRLLSFASRLQQAGGNFMEFEVFDKTDIERYKDEAKARWGATAVYAQFEQKLAAQTDDEAAQAANGLMQQLARLGALRDEAPDSPAARQAVAALQGYITAHYYDCTDEILRGLGQMYVQDERMKQNIDRAAGEGAAEFASRAIRAYCERNGG